MARIKSRSVKMTEKFVMRATPDDIINIRKSAQSKGLDPSALVRGLLIAANIITPQ